MRIGALRAAALGTTPLRQLRAGLRLGMQGENGRDCIASTASARLRRGRRARRAERGQRPALQRRGRGRAGAERRGLVGRRAARGLPRRHPRPRPARWLNVPPRCAAARCGQRGGRPPSLDVKAAVRPFAAWPIGALEASTQALDLAALSSAAALDRAERHGDARQRCRGQAGEPRRRARQRARRPRRTRACCRCARCAWTCARGPTRPSTSSCTTSTPCSAARSSRPAMCRAAAAGATARRRSICAWPTCARACSMRAHRRCSWAAARRCRPRGCSRRARRPRRRARLASRIDGTLPLGGASSACSCGSMPGCAADRIELHKATAQAGASRAALAGAAEARERRLARARQGLAGEARPGDVVAGPRRLGLAAGPHRLNAKVDPTALADGGARRSKSSRRIAAARPRPRRAARQHARRGADRRPHRLRQRRHGAGRRGDEGGARLPQLQATLDVAGAHVVASGRIDTGSGAADHWDVDAQGGDTGAARAAAAPGERRAAGAGRPHRPAGERRRPLARLSARAAARSWRSCASTMCASPRAARAGGSAARRARRSRSRPICER